MPTETAKLTEGRINSMGAVEVATSSVKTEEPTESGAEEGNSVTKPQKGVPEGWLRSVVEQQEEILKNNPIVKEEKIHDPVDSESKHILEQNVHKREVIDYVKQRLKQLPIEKDEQAALNQMFRKVIGDPPPLSSKKKSMKFDKPAEQDCKSSNDLLEVSKLEHADAMRRSFRLLSQLGLDEVRRLYGSHSINRVRAAIFQLRQLQANRRSTVLRLQALKRRQTAMGNAHVRHLPTGINATYTCYFCSCGFSSVTQLHAHLLTQAHLCVNTPLGSGSVMGHKQTAIQVLEGQANNSNATDLDMHPQTKKPDTELNRLLQNLKQIDQKKDATVAPGRKSRHGADRGVTHCALCEVEFRPPTVNTGDIIRTMAGVYQRHLMTEHLPSLELTEKLLYMGSFLSFNRDYLFSYRASRYPIPAWLERNVADVPEEIRKKLRMATHAQHLSCRACKSGLMPSVRALITHIRDEHAKTLEARMIQMRRSGTFSGLIDPTRTCFQCYTILEDHFAFQIHTIVFHGARYPLVCGLCKHPLVNLCMTEEIQSFCAQLFDECGIKMDEEKWKRVLHMKPASQQCASTKSSGRGLLTTTEEPDLLGNRLLLDDEARALLEEEELATIVSCVKASMSVLRYSAQLVLRAMQ
ncbi:unnamed protein product, partial [Echinostoma caproni]|uniref:C2H2-type domain-containing protein n=1 Tax=Echinostoma caproni TaxID=27848 RepID=A0A183AMN5_9TREM